MTHFRPDKIIFQFEGRGYLYVYTTLLLVLKATPNSGVKSARVWGYADSKRVGKSIFYEGWGPYVFIDIPHPNNNPTEPLVPFERPPACRNLVNRQLKFYLL